MDLEAIRGIAERLMKGRKAHLEREVGGVYYHGQRTARAVLTLREAVLPGEDSYDEILRAAAMLHDVGKGIEPHNHYGALIAGDVLAGIVTEHERSEIVRIIDAHCDRCPGTDRYDDWCRLMQDADLLDHFGAQEIWMNFHYQAHTDGSMLGSLEFWENIGPYIEKHAAMLNYDISLRIFEEKAEFLRQFIKRLAIEAHGDYVPLC